ncbi:MAG: CUB domain-containing protein [Sphingobacteriales bacterium]|nr:CUB domain-containing protein [Sphingobacteriales bacterium]
MNRYYCTTQSTCAPVTIQLISLPLTCTYTVPYSGSNSITTNSGAICDHAGTADYSNGANGYTVIYPSNTNSLIRLAFNQFTTEGSYDFVTIFDGVGVGGTILYGPTSGSPGLPTVTSLSGPLTIRFTSDGSVVYAGFNATISNIACTPPAVPGFGNGTWNVLGYTGGNIDLSGTFLDTIPKATYPTIL